MTNSSIYNLRQSINENNLKRWQDWSVSINYVVDQFNDVVTNLTERLDIAEATIEALMTKINNMSDASTGLKNYVKLQYDSILISSNSRTYYAKPCGVFSYTGNADNIVYIYSNKTVEGLYVNNKQVTYNSSISSNSSIYYPFYQISGSDSGTIINIVTNNATKISGDINLCFSLNASLPDLTREDSSTSIMKVRIKLASIVQKQLVTLDKSELSRTIIKTTPVPAEKVTVSKNSEAIGQYSTTKTIATIAKQKNEIKKRTLNNE